MSRKHWMLFGFFLIIVGLFAALALPRLGLGLIWLGTILAWFGLAVAVEGKPWAPASRRALQVVIGAAALAIAMSAAPLSLGGYLLCVLIGAAIGAFASKWGRWLGTR